MTSTIAGSRNRKYRSLEAALLGVGIDIKAPGVADGIIAADRSFKGFLKHVPPSLRIEYAVEVIRCEHPNLPGGSPRRKMELQTEIEKRGVPYYDVMSVSASIAGAVAKAFLKKSKKPRR